jgi:3-oxoacyl-[acyl-carrier-protein] synthase III
MAQIVAIGTSVPQFIATNEYILSDVLHLSRTTYIDAENDLEHMVRTFFEKAGARHRRWRTGCTKPIEHITEAWENCFARLTDSQKAKIGTVIYCGIDKGVAEPSHASLLAQKFKLANARCLDVSDACMGWFTATQIASQFATRDTPFCAVVSAEFPLEMPGRVYPQSFTIKNREDFEWKGAALTMGEAASVTVIDSFSGKPAHFVHRSSSKYADVCCVPLLRAERFVDSARLLPKLHDDCFVANMPFMAVGSRRDAEEVLEEYIRKYGKPDIVLPHTVSESGPRRASENHLAEGVLKNCFEHFGNLSTSSIPIGYEYFNCSSNAHVAGWISAAGMSHAIFRLW